MNFDQSEEQRLLAASIRRFVDRDYAFEARRAIVASAPGFSPDAWRALADLGVLALALPIEHGGFGGTAVDLMSTMEAIGEALIVEPFLSTVGLGARFVGRGGSREQQARILPAVGAGNLQLAFAHAEADARYDPAFVATRASRSGGGYRLDGEKRVVLGAPSADVLAVSVRTSGQPGDSEGLSVLLVDAGAPGVSMRAHRTLDGLRAADVTFANVEVAAGALIGVENEGLPLIDEVQDYATALLCAEAVGAIGYANAATLEYLKTRRQFGVPIGSFQALQHRMVNMVIRREQVRSLASLACATVDAETDRAARMRMVSAAKIGIADACRHVSQEAVQLHGGMGMSDELKISHTFRRLTMIAQQFGDADYHLARFAGSSGAASPHRSHES